MRNLFVYLIIPGLFVFFSCNDERDHTASADAQKTLISDIKLGHSEKGWELYSWHAGNDWKFSVIVGTNRGKTFEEVYNNKTAVTGTDSLKALLLQLPAQENIFWREDLGLDKNDVIKFPDAKLMDEMKAFCLERKLVLHIISRL